jgi:thiosulfate/3-mercaptopyruvate sulfurtransferase
VVIYDDLGGLNAGRLFLELERLGHPAVSVLDGGLVKWVLDGRRVDNRVATRPPATYTVSGGRRENIATVQEVKQAKPDAVLLLDVRSRDEYQGDPKQPRSGHVPGARLWPWEQAIRTDGGFVVRDARELRASLDTVGLGDKRLPVVLYCRSGHRAGQTYLTLRHLGYENVRVFAGSMLEYLLDAGAPVKRGLVP